MKARDILTAIGLALLALGPELQMEGGTPLEWRLGRYARLVGVALLGSRAVPALNRSTQPAPKSPTKRRR